MSFSTWLTCNHATTSLLLSIPHVHLICPTCPLSAFSLVVPPRTIVSPHIPPACPIPARGLHSPRRHPLLQHGLEQFRCLLTPHVRPASRQLPNLSHSVRRTRKPMRPRQPNAQNHVEDQHVRPFQ